MENEYKGSLYAVRPINSLTIVEDMYYLVKQYDSDKDNSTNKTKLHFDINTLLSKVIEFVEFNKVSNSDYNDIERYFKKLVEVRNELEPEINTEESKQLSDAQDFYKIVGKRLSDSEQPKQPINENWSDSLQAILSNKKSNSEKDEKKRPADVTKKTFIDIGIVLASEEFNEMKKSKKDDTEITKHFFPHLTEETYPTLGTVRIYLNGSYNVGCGRFWNHGSRNTEVFDAIENHYKNNNKEIDPKFKEGMTKIRQKQ